MRRQLESVHDAHHTRNIYSRTMSAIQLAGMLSLRPNTKDEHLGVKREGHTTPQTLSTNQLICTPLQVTLNFIFAGLMPTSLHSKH